MNQILTPKGPTIDTAGENVSINNAEKLRDTTRIMNIVLSISTALVMVTAIAGIATFGNDEIVQGENEKGERPISEYLLLFSLIGMAISAIAMKLSLKSLTESSVIDMDDLNNLVATIKKLEKEVLEMKEALENEIKEKERALKELKESETAKHLEEILELKKIHGKEVEGLESSIKTLNVKLQKLESKLQELESSNFENLRKVADSSIIIETSDAISSMQERLQTLSSRLRSLSNGEIKEGEFYILFSVNPDVTRLIEGVETRLDAMITAFCGEDNPMQAENAEMLLPFVETLKMIKSRAGRNEFKLAREEAFKLIGGLDAIESFAGEEETEQEETKDFFAILGIVVETVWSEAFSEEVKQVYRKLARECHPDHHPDDPEAEERFKDINEAYRVLSDKDSFNQYIKYNYQS